jgi:hypothetical protein
VTLSQEFLEDQEISRIRWLRPDLAGLIERSGLAAVRAELTAAPELAGTLAVCVVRRFDLATWIRGTCAFTAGLAPDQARAWRRSFTRTAFLAGNPDNLAGRFDFAQVSDDGSAAWAGPAEAKELAGLRRLLKMFESPQRLPPLPDLSVQLPAVPGDPGRSARPPVRRRLYVATAGLTLAACMVNLNHLLAEAILRGLTGPGDVLAVRQVPRLGGVPEPLAALRTGIDPDSPARLRAFAALTKEIAID